jgi:hypothetical protein
MDELADRGIDLQPVSSQSECKRLNMFSSY